MSPLATLILLVAIAWAAIYIIVAFFGWKVRPIATLEEYFVAGRRIGLAVLLLTVASGTWSGWFFFGVPGFSYLAGWQTMNAATAYCIFQAFTIIACGYPLWFLGKKYGYISSTDAFADRYESKILGPLWAVIALIFMAPYLAGQVIASGAAFTGATLGELPYMFGIYYMVVLVVIYTAIGGLRSVAWVSAVQAVLFIAMTVAGYMYMAASLPEGLVNSVQQMVKTTPSFIAGVGPIGYWTIPMYISWLFLLSGAFGWWPHLLPRAYAAKNPKINLYIGAGILFLGFIITWQWAFPGLVCRILFPGLPPTRVDEALPLFLGKYTPPWFAAFVIAGGLAGIMTTASVLLLTCTQLIVRDILYVIRPLADERRLVRYSRIITLIWGLICILIGALRPGIIVVIAGIGLAGFVCFLPAIWGAIWWRRGNKYGAIASVLAGTVMMFYQAFTGLAKVSLFGFHPILWALIISTVVYIVVSLVTPPPSKEIQAKWHDYLNKVLFQYKFTKTKTAKT